MKYVAQNAYILLNFSKLVYTTDILISSYKFSKKKRDMYSVSALNLLNMPFECRKTKTCIAVTRLI